MACRGVCRLYRYKRVCREKIYAEGGKRCTQCAIYVKWDGLRCPCCNYRLRARSWGKGSRPAEFYTGRI